MSSLLSLQPYYALAAAVNTLLDKENQSASSSSSAATSSSTSLKWNSTSSVAVRDIVPSPTTPHITATSPLLSFPSPIALIKSPNKDTFEDEPPATIEMSLIKGKGSMFVIRLFILSIWGVTPLAWAYVLVSLFTEWRFASSLHFFLLPYCLAECVFSLYHAYLKRKVQAPGPPPQYGRRYLRDVMSRALLAGLQDTSDDEDSDEDIDAPSLPVVKASGVLKNGLNLRQRITPPANLSSLAIPKTNGPDRLGVKSPFPKSPFPMTPGTAMRFQEVELRERTKRLRRGSYVPPYIEQALHKNDPRAIKFRKLYAMWFRPRENATVTRGAIDKWLAWALYGEELSTIQDEHDELEAKKLLRLQGSDVEDSSPDNSPPSSPVPESAPPTSATMNGESLKDEPLFSAFYDEQVKRHIPTDGEWEDPVRGDRLSFVDYCRRLIEARQGFAYPLKRPANEPQEDVTPLRLTVDPCRVSSRPLAWYCLVNTVTNLAIWTACRAGFVKESKRDIEYLIWRPPGWTKELANDKSGKYRPIFIFHGLGIGIGQYRNLIGFFLKSHLRETHPIVIPLQPHVSQNIFHSEFLKPPGHDRTVTALRRVIIDEQWDECGVVVLSHSMGTVMHAWLLKSIGSFVRRSVFVDPVVFCLWIPWVCGSFVYWRADTPIKLLMRYFVARELGTASQFRHFNWSSNLLWPETEIPRVHDPHFTRIFLAGEDAIVNAPEVRKYLREHGLRDARNGGNIHYYPKAAHGELLMHDGQAMGSIIRWLEEPDAE